MNLRESQLTLMVIAETEKIHTIKLLHVGLHGFEFFICENKHALATQK